MSRVPPADKPRSNWRYYRIVFGIVALSLVISFWRIYQHQTQLNLEVEMAIQELRQEKALCDKECSVLIDRIAARIEMGMPIHPAFVTRKSDAELNEKAIPLMIANLKDKRSAVVSNSLTDIEALLVRDENPERWKSDLLQALLPMFEYRTRDQQLVRILLLVKVDHEVIRSRLIDNVDFNDIDTVLHAGKVMQSSFSDLDPLPMYVDYLRQRDYEAMRIVEEIEMDSIGGYALVESMNDRFLAALHREMLEAKTPQQQSRLQVWIDYAKDPSTLPERFQTSPRFMPGNIRVSPDDTPNSTTFRPIVNLPFLPKNDSP